MPIRQFAQSLVTTGQTTLQRWLRWPAARPVASSPSQALTVEEAEAGHLEPYDETLLEKSRTQWQFGDWESLTRLEHDALDHHPDRAKLALLAATGHQQMGDMNAARQFVRLAQKWGCSKRLVSQALISGVYNTLGRAAAIKQDEARSHRYFQAAITAGASGSDVRLLTQARMGQQLARIAWSSAMPEVAQVRHYLADSIPVAKFAIAPELSAAAMRPPAWLTTLIEDCLQHQDVHAAIDETTVSQHFSPTEWVHWYLLLSQAFQMRKDKLTAEHFANLARHALPMDQPGLVAVVVQHLTWIGRQDDAMELMVEHALGVSAVTKALNNQELAQVQQAFQRSRQTAKARNQHGQLLLLEYLNTHLKGYTATLDGRRPVLIEVGTTREEVSGQGSTRQLAMFCRDHGLDFITVDMDPHNTRMAQQLFDQSGCKFQAVTMKGEDYLRNLQNPIDFAFLDAYDFDHGGHSALRQSRYVQFLGSRIDEQQCHQMHLDCAQSLATKLTPQGAICIDDTWLENAQWTAKGTLAVPYLLEHGFEVIQTRNRAVLLRRKGAE